MPGIIRGYALLIFTITETSIHNPLLPIILFHHLLNRHLRLLRPQPYSHPVNKNHRVFDIRKQAFYLIIDNLSFRYESISRTVINFIPDFPVRIFFFSLFFFIPVYRQAKRYPRVVVA
jgi:hypothetical protein